MLKFSLIAMGGTFDIIHQGHITLLSTGFEISDKVIIGLTSDEIIQLNNDFGPAVLEKEVQALVVSDETSDQGNVLNKLRSERNLSPVEIITVPMFLAKDGVRISTTRIKNSEIDSDGNLLPIDK